MVVISILFFLLGLALLLIGSEGIISKALAISRLTKIPPLIIGATIVALGTSLPEITVSLFSGFEHVPGLALGNIVGSNIANIGLVLGITLIIQSVYVGRTKTQKNMVVTLIASIFLFVLLIVDGISLTEGIMLILLGFGVMIWQIVQGRKADFEELENVNKSHGPILTTVLFLLSLGSLIIGGKLIVDAGVQIATFFNIPRSLIGATAVAVGTSLPELSISILAAIKKGTTNEKKLIIGNILGSNMYNIFFGVGVLALFGIPIFDSLISLYTFALFTIMLAFLIFFYRGRNIPKYFGYVLLGGYLIYIYLLFS